MVKKHTTPTPHDSVFKAFLTDPDTARDFLTIHLPPALLAVCDLDTLQLSSGSFIEEHLCAVVLNGRKICAENAHFKISLLRFFYG